MTLESRITRLEAQLASLLARQPAPPPPIQSRDPRIILAHKIARAVEHYNAIPYGTLVQPKNGKRGPNSTAEARYLAFYLIKQHAFKTQRGATQRIADFFSIDHGAVSTGIDTIAHRRKTYPDLDLQIQTIQRELNLDGRVTTSPQPQPLEGRVTTSPQPQPLEGRVTTSPQPQPWKGELPRAPNPMTTITIQITEPEASAITGLLRARDTADWYKYNTEDYALTDAVLARILREYVIQSTPPTPSTSTPPPKARP